MSRSKKITELPVSNSVVGEDLLLTVTNPSNNATTRSISVKNFLENNNSNVVIQKITPENSTSNSITGTVTFDDDYLYVTIANNLIKRITLESF